MEFNLTVRGIVLALKNIGTFLSTFGISGIRRDPIEFFYLFFTYMLINTPTDLLLLSYWNHNDKKNKNESESGSSVTGEVG